MTNVIYALIVLGALGALFGLVLAVAGKKFAVKVDEKQEAVRECLPGANCGGCGFPGCDGYAEAIAAGKAAVNCCTSLDEAGIARIAEIMGVKAETAEKRVALVRCTGTNGHKQLKYDYVGLQDCLSASRLAGGPNECADGCIGLGSCVKACRFGAMSIADGVAKVDREKCTGCMQCAAACPKKLIVKVPYDSKVVIPCASKAKGVQVRKFCDFGCIGCSLCVKKCPQEAITVENNLASIDYSKCLGCGACVEACPRKIITVIE